ncbi:MAG: CAP domain-containing protein [Sphingomonadaceae bacterium]|nr:CAP domain-containing protein [Sphingomonadaceae bacterium]
MTRRLMLAFALLCAFSGTAHAQRSGDIAAREAAVLAEMNRARADPQGYADVLREYRGYFRGDIFRLPGNPVGILTTEGVAAVDEAIAFLERQEPLPPFEASALLAGAADDHVAEQGPRGALGHASRNGDRAGQRSQGRGGGRYVAEAISYGPSQGAEVVRQLIVDDGVPDRGHRTLIFTSEFTYAGVGCGDHARFDNMCVIDFGTTATGHYQVGASE